MKASDFVTTSTERDVSSRELLRTEETDAVNSGIVGSADKSGSALKGAAAVHQAVKGGVSNATLAAITGGRGGKTTGASGKDFGAATTVGESTQDEAGAVGAALAGRQSLKSGLKGGAKAAATAMVGGKALEDTEFEGADDLYYRGRAIKRLASRARARFGTPKGRVGAVGNRSPSPSGRGGAVTSGKGGLGPLSEKGTRKKARSAAEAKREAQMSGYFKRSVYSTAQHPATAARAGKGAATAVQGGVKGIASVLGSASAPLLLGILAVVLVLALIASIAGGEAEEERKSASLDGMPNWVTYELVLSCLEARDEYGYPASALLGQMMIENGTSDDGSILGREYHNYGGVKYSGNSYGGLITGSVKLLTTEYSATGTAYQTYASFAVFASDKAYMTYRCEHLYKQSNYTSQPNYQKAIDGNNSELFLQALGEGGYYTAPVSSYLAQYRSICSAYPLVPQLDGMTVEEFQSMFSGTVGGGQDYASAEQWQKGIVDACSQVKWPGASLCATWTTRVYAAAGHTVHGNGNSQLGNQGYGANYYPSRATTDLSQIKVGMLISAQYGSNTAAGNAYGHVGIYIGDGKVMDSTSAGIRTISLSDWVSQNNRGWVVCGYPWDWR